MSKRRFLLLAWSALSLSGLAALVAVALLVAPHRGPEQTPDAVTSVLSREVGESMVSIRFEERAEAAGLAFRHFPARRGSLLPEDMGSGLAWGDYDGDGDPDLFLVNFAGSLEAADAAGRSALFRNDDGHFSDVSVEAGLAFTDFGLGACWGDYDNDGDLDLYLTNYGPNRLLRNDAGAFAEVSAAAGVDDGRFSAGCAWADYDNDGLLDLYVTNYVDFVLRPEDRDRSALHGSTGIPYTLNPSSYSPAGNRLYRNLGDGRFTDTARHAGVENPDGRSLSVAWVDFDDDGLLDLYVANDVSANGVYRNRGDGRFEDIGAASLAADYRGAMGLAVGDYEADGDPDLFVTHWLAQENAFFQNMHSEEILDAEGRHLTFFADGADLLGLGQQSLRMVGWATGFADLDNDGLLDLWVVNGNTLEEPGDPSRLQAQPMQIFRQRAEAGFFEMAAQACPDLGRPLVGRGGAQADYDGDGRLDLAVVSFGERPLLLRNTSPGAGHWLALRLRQDGGNTHAIGARVWVTAGGRTQNAQVGAQGSYLSQHADTVHFGLGDVDHVEEVRIRWPDGTVEHHVGVAVDRVLELRHTANYIRPERDATSADTDHSQR